MRSGGLDPSDSKNDIFSLIAYDDFCKSEDRFVSYIALLFIMQSCQKIKEVFTNSPLLQL